MPDLSKHFQIILGLLLQTVSLQFFPLLRKPFGSFVQLLLNGFKRCFKALRTGHEEFLWMNPSFLERIECLPTDRVANLDAFDAIKVKDDAKRVIPTRHPNVDNLSSYPAFTSFDIGRGAAVLEFDQLSKKIARLNGLTNMAPKMVFKERFRGIQPVDARNR